MPSVGFKTSEGKMTMAGGGAAGLVLLTGLIGDGSALTWKMVAVIGILVLGNVGYSLARGWAKGSINGNSR